MKKISTKCLLLKSLFYVSAFYVLRTFVGNVFVLNYPNYVCYITFKYIKS